MEVFLVHELVFVRVDLGGKVILVGSLIDYFLGTFVHRVEHEDFFERLYLNLKFHLNTTNHPHKTIQFRAKNVFRPLPYR